jgi:hypothetical protein
MKRISVFLIIFITIMGFVSYRSHAGNNFVVIKLSNGVSVDIPRNWQVATRDQQITLDTVVQSQLDLSNIPQGSSDLGFVAGYFDDAGDKAKVNVRYYPDIKITQDSIRNMSPKELVEFDNALKQSSYKGAKAAGGSILQWNGTQKKNIAGRIALVTEYRRPPLPRARRELQCLSDSHT